MHVISRKKKNHLHFFQSENNNFFVTLISFITLAAESVAALLKTCNIGKIASDTVSSKYNYFRVELTRRAEPI